MVATNPPPRAPADNLVPPEDACPNCKQRDADLLEWIDDDHVQCSVCRTVYTPGKGG